MLVFQALQGGGDAAATGNEICRGFTVDGHHRGSAQQAAQLHSITHGLAGGGDDTDGGGLGIPSRHVPLLSAYRFASWSQSHRIVTRDCNTIGNEAHSLLKTLSCVYQVRRE